MVIDKVYQLISFKQSKWFEKYLPFNTQKRNKANTEFEKRFNKLMNIW